MFYAHSKENTTEDSWQTLYTHLNDTSKLSARYADKFDAGEFARIAGLLHDAGKYSLEFQKRLRGTKNPVNHSTAGAQEAFKKYGLPGLILAYAIAGHHAGLPDWVEAGSDASLKVRLAQTDLPDYKAFYNEVNMPNKLPGFPIKIQNKSDICFAFFFLIRMLYSCLVDADFLDTEKFVNPRISEKREIEADFDKLIEMFDKYMEPKLAKNADKVINKKRKEILDSCIIKSTSPKNMFSLKVPTGGGKTLSSLAFALGHAKEHKMDRIIYVIPYTSIIEQNASVFRDVFGDQFVLEHHSNFQFEKSAKFGEKADDSEFEYEINPVKLAAENWNIPIVATTNVQFFESLFSNRSSHCRKLHNICNSIIILDEAQMLPLEFLKPCLSALCELINNYGCSIVLCTATQPDFNHLLPEGMRPIEIINNSSDLFASFKRVNIVNIGNQTDEELGKKLINHDQVLCIVNTKTHASKLYDLIEEYEGSYHLSTFMCPKHRNETLSSIKERLSERIRRPNIPCRVVSTQLVEAGVDLDFPSVYRAIAGIDSINQAAGRCNREGSPVLGKVFVFEPEKPLASDSFLARAASIGRSVMRKHEDPMSLEAIEEYFQQLYQLDDKLLDKYEIIKSINDCGQELHFPFATIAREFELISKNQMPVIISFDENCLKLLSSAEWMDKPMSLLRKLQPYTVQLEYYQFAALQKNLLIDNFAQSFYMLNNMSYYDIKKGLLMPKGIAPLDVLIR